MVHVGNIEELQYKCIQSLRKHSVESKIVLYTILKESRGLERLKKFDVEIRELKEERWSNRKMACKIETIKEVVDFCADSDKVLILDTDLYFKGDPFSLFEADGDIFITSRGYKYKWAINAGVWGFVNNDNSRKFLDYFIEQINHPTWKKLLKFRKKAKRSETLDWWVDQDFLCVVYKHSLPKNLMTINITDVGPRYNYCPSTDILGPERAKKELEIAIEDENVIILHLKASLKDIFDIGKLA
jgi:hypothetical protein